MFIRTAIYLIFMAALTEIFIFGNGQLENHKISYSLIYLGGIIAIFFSIRKAKQKKQVN